MTASKTIRRMVDANPVPDPGHLHMDAADAERLFSSIERRRDLVIGAPVQPPPGPVRPPAWRPWYRRPAVVFLLGVTVVLLVAAPLLLLGSGDGDVAEPTTPELFRLTTAPVATPTTSAPTVDTQPSETNQPFELGAWQLVRPPVELRESSTSAVTRVVATEVGFLAVAGSDGDGLWASPDGIEWTEISRSRDPVGLGVGVDILDLAANGDLIAAVVHNGWDAVAGVVSSTDGRTWTFTELSDWSVPSDPPPAVPRSIVAFGSGGFVVSGSGIWVSIEGETFERVDMDAPVVQELDLELNPIRSSASDRQTVVLGTQENLLVSMDGTRWELVPIPETVDRTGTPCASLGLEQIGYGPAGFVAVGSCGPHGTAWTSSDGLAWAQVPMDEPAFADPAWIRPIIGSERGYLAGGRTGPDGELMTAAIWTSHDGAEWTRTILGQPGIEGGVLEMATQNDTVVAVGWLGNEAAVWHSRLPR